MKERPLNIGMGEIWHMALIQYFGQPMLVCCDGYCSKAWGISTRPKAQLSDDPDDFEYLADDELDVAPVDPGTYEGGYGKPKNVAHFPNKWCVRECERCAHSNPEQWHRPIAPRVFDQRVRNVR